MGRKFSHSVIFSESRARAGRHAWLLVTPAALSPTGKRRQQAFATEKAAKQALRHAEQTREALGLNMRHVVTDLGEQAQWLRDRELAAKAGLSVSSAVAFAAQCVAEFDDLSHTLELARWAKGRAMQAWPDITLADALVEFDASSGHLSQTYRTARGCKRRRLMRDAYEFCMNTYLHQLNAQNVAALLDGMRLTDMTWNVYLSELKSLIKWAQDKGYVDPESHPLRRLKPKLSEEAEIVCLTPAELSHLLRTACNKNSPGIALHVALCAFAGIRPAEAARLTWSDVGTEENYISVRGKHSKTGGTRHITLRPVLRAWLDYLCPPAARQPHDLIAEGWSVARSQRMHKAAGMSDWRKDVLRHSFASYSLKAGTPLHDLQTDMGHVDLSLLRSRYLNMTGITSASAAQWWSLTPQVVLEST